MNQNDAIDAIGQAGPGDLEEVIALYGAVCDHLAAGPRNYSGWTRDSYPTRDTALEWLKQGALYLLRAEGRVAATIALTHAQEEGYQKGQWSVPAESDQIFALHTIATHPDFHRRGYSAALMEFAKEEGRRQNMKALRLDVCDYNAPAIACYEKAGFHCVGKLDLFGHPPPYHLYRLYEFAL